MATRESEARTNGGPEVRRTDGGPTVGDREIAADATRNRRLDGESITHLVRRLADEMGTLFTKEVALLRSETTAAIHSARTGIGAVASGAAVTYAGLLVLLGAAVLGLSLVVAPWLAALIVGAVVLIAGFVMLKAGQKKLEPAAFKPDHTQASMRKDREALKGAHHER